MTIRMIGPNDPAVEALKPILAEHPEWNAQIEIIPWDNYYDALMTYLRAEICPVQAVFIPGHVWLDSLIQAGLVVPLPLDQVDHEILSAYCKDDLLPSVRYECTRNGELFLIPWFSDGHVVFYDSRLGELEGELSEGVAVLRPSRMAEFAGKLHQPPHRYGLALKADASEMFLDWLPYLWDFGGDLFDDDLNPMFDSREGVSSLEEYVALRRFCPPEVHRCGNAEIARLLKEGKVGLATTWGGQAAAIFGEAVEQETLIPYKAGLYPQPWNATWGIGLPAHQPADFRMRVCEFLLKIADEDMDVHILRVAGSPIRVSTYSDENFAAFFWLKAQWEMLKRCRTLPFTPHLSKILGVMYPAVYAAFVGEKSASQALQEASWQIRQFLREG